MRRRGWTKVPSIDCDGSHGCGAFCAAEKDQGDDGDFFDDGGCQRWAGAWRGSTRLHRKRADYEEQRAPVAHEEQRDAFGCCWTRTPIAIRGEGRDSAARPPAAVATPETISIHEMDAASIFPPAFSNEYDSGDFRPANISPTIVRTRAPTAIPPAMIAPSVKRATAGALGQSAVSGRAWPCRKTQPFPGLRNGSKHPRRAYRSMNCNPASCWTPTRCPQDRWTHRPVNCIPPPLYPPPFGEIGSPVFMPGGQVSVRAPQSSVSPPPGAKLETQTWSLPSMDTAQAPQMLPPPWKGEPGAWLPSGRIIVTLPWPGCDGQPINHDVIDVR